MKLIIQVPCFNEEATIAQTVADLPHKIDGVSQIEYLVIDDGSSDDTVLEAKRAGVHHILKLGSNCGLATAFTSGIDFAISKGADIVVNTDGDNQYQGADIVELIKPIINGQADFVVGCRAILRHKEFGTVKKLLQCFGSWVLRYLSKTKVKDTTSGFRAYSRDTCLKMKLYTSFSHCAESLIQAGNIGLRVASVDIRTNPKTRESRLFNGVPSYIYKQGKTIVWMFILYRPGVFFFNIGSVFLGVSAILGFRFLYILYFTDMVQYGRTHLPSLILLSILGLIGIIFWALGILGELVSFHRRISENVLYLLRKNPQPKNVLQDRPEKHVC
ncbi:MAG: glycosyltransferase family 2 protein [Gammaproteobacteria bacterium]|nr:glycosyltransferase family 2 protein [Gammaproteobacteria bacterium]MCH9743678.1 glycosyltransferase family 2 protein [Gammaproteobacteria bacterium]